MAAGPVVIGVAGGSGSGKTTVVRRIVESLGNDQVTVLEHDRYYRYRSDLRLEERAALNYDHPDSLETDLLVRHLDRLAAAQQLQVPDHQVGLEGIRMVVVQRRTLLEAQVAPVPVVAVVLEHRHLVVAEALDDAPDDGGLARPRSARDANHHRPMFHSAASALAILQ
jgi:uridine kinase